MSKSGGGKGGPWHDPVPIGDIAAPPFVRLPDPQTLFARRAERFAAAADGHELGPYLRFLAELAACQHCVQRNLPELKMPTGNARQRTHSHVTRANDPGLSHPPLSEEGREWDAALDQLFAEASGIEMPEPARTALNHVRSADAGARLAMVRSVLTDAMPVETLAEHVYVAAALQVHFARLAAGLDPGTLTPIGDGVCPACGAAPVASSIVGWRAAHGARFCTCSLCATQWHVVRIKCVLCGSTKGISYQEVDGGTGAVKAEVCDECHGYVKILHQHLSPALDPVADDVATCGLDLLLRAKGYRRGAVNPFLIGY
jgi:FdhE protein